MVDVIVGIDLGTSGYSVMMFTPDGEFEFEPILDSEDLDRTPCYVVHVTDTLIARVGLIAKQIEKHHKGSFVVYEPKRLIGLNFSDENVQRLRKLLYSLRNGNRERLEMIMKRGNEIICTTPFDTYISLLKNIQRTIRQSIKNCSAIKVAMTVPPKFTYEQYQATSLSARMIGFEVLDLDDEHTTLAKNYFYHYDELEPNEYFLVYDLGASDFKITIFKVAGDYHCDIVSTSVVPGLSGLTFDFQLLNYIVEELNSSPGFYLTYTRDMVRQILIKSEEARINLSKATASTIVLKNIPVVNEITLEISRTKFEEVVDCLLKLTVHVVYQFLNDEQFSIDDIEKIILYGGLARTPKIRQLLFEHFGDKMSNELVFKNTSIAEGAALVAAQLTYKPPHPID